MGAIAHYTLRKSYFSSGNFSGSRLKRVRPTGVALYQTRDHSRLFTSFPLATLVTDTTSGQFEPTAARPFSHHPQASVSPPTITQSYIRMTQRTKLSKMRLPILLREPRRRS
jgi:hypothetical protein